MNALCRSSRSDQLARFADHRPERQRLRAQELVVGGGDNVRLVKLADWRPRLERGGLAPASALLGVVFGNRQPSHLLDELIEWIAHGSDSSRNARRQTSMPSTA